MKYDLKGRTNVLGICMKVFKIIGLIVIFSLNCTIKKTKTSRKPIMFHPKTYYNQHRPKYSPFENYVAPNQINDRGVQYKKK